MNKKEKLLPQKMFFKTWWVSKIAPSKSTFQNIDGFLKLLRKKMYFQNFYTSKNQ